LVDGSTSVCVMEDGVLLVGNVVERGRKKCYAVAERLELRAGLVGGLRLPAGKSHRAQLGEGAR
jgi:hypothetical protein